MRLQYFLPWWPSDYVWQEWTVAHDLDRCKDWNKVYLWDYLPELLDGILISRMAVSPKRIQTLRRDIRFEGYILGDSGAHSYRDEDEPPFSCQELLEFYACGQFNAGLILDMVASPWVRPGGLTPVELEQRLQLTIDNAEQCLKLHTRYGYPFELIGVVQGWSVESYRRCARALLEIGFDYLAVAGQLKLSLIKESILAIKEEIHQAGRPVKLHILGTGNPKILAFYMQQEITSFDSATWLRKAWLSHQHNYFMTEGTAYTACRATRLGLGELDEAKLEWTAEVSCPCPFCQALGQEILLFRGHERNTRRGFHNIYQYIKMVKAHQGQAVAETQI